MGDLLMLSDVMDMDDWWVPESPDDLGDGDELGKVYFAGAGYTPGHVKRLARQLEDLAAVAEQAARRHPPVPADLTASTTEKEFDF
jgi:mannose/cellobiose epimerase-like protein (N-acyl-D-glucosamine 2-epimerase family)